MRKYSDQEITNPSFPVYSVRIPGFERFAITFGHAVPVRPIVERIHGVREPETTEIFKAAVAPGDVVLEGGACYGYMTMQLSQLVGSEGKVISLEPSAPHRLLLEWTIQRNQRDNVQVRDEFLTDHRAFKVDRKIAQKKTSLARLLKSIDPKPDVIFLDIEGYELPMLWKALDDDIFKDYRPTIIFQPHYSLYEKRHPKESFEKLWKAMTVFGYEMHRLEYLIVCLPGERDDAQQPAIHKLLHSGL